MFREFPKVPRLTREVVVTEKIDGTNACVAIIDGTHLYDPNVTPVAAVGPLTIYAQSRTRIITPEDDNFGFARWVRDNAEELAQLGPGHHFGEWWGRGIQRGYGLQERRFSLFNVARWLRVGEYPTDDTRLFPPACCDAVPVLYRGPFDTARIDEELKLLRDFGSLAAPGFSKPEGVMLYHTAAGQYFQKTIEKDDAPKGAR